MIKKILFAFCLFSMLTSFGRSAGSQPVPVTTQIVASQCGQLLPAINTAIYANYVQGASSYMFKITTALPDGSLQTQTRISPLRVFNLTQLASYAFSKTYTIEVSVNYGGIWQPFGAACNVTTPTPLTAISSSQCGITMASMGDPIYANLVAFAPGYRFRITNAGNPSQVYIVDRSLREMRLENFQVLSGTTYNIDVAVKNFDGTYLPFGPVCSITAPVLTTKIMSSFCGRVMSSFSEYIYADLVAGAAGYRFKVTNMATSSVQYIDRPLRTITMAMVANVQYSTAYRIEVAIKGAQGNYLSFGPFCTVFTPILTVPKIQLSQCEMTCTTTTEMMYADDYPGATVYRFRLENPELGYNYYIERNSRCYNLNMFPGLQPNIAYTVKVAVKVNGVFTGYGKACDVTTPPVFADTRLANPKNQDAGTSFMSKPYPNPFADYFSIDAALPADAEVSVRVFDMTGRLLDSIVYSGAELAGARFGVGYPPGVYNVVVHYNERAETLRVIKR